MRFFMQGFASPIIFLSLANVISNAYKHKDSVDTDPRHNYGRHEDLPQEAVITEPNTVSAVNIAISDPRSGEVKEESILISERQLSTAEFLKQELDKNGVILPEW